MGNLPIHIYGYNKEHDVIVYAVIKDTQSGCGQPCHRFQKSPLFLLMSLHFICSVLFCETLPRIWNNHFIKAIIPVKPWFTVNCKPL